MMQKACEATQAFQVNQSYLSSWLLLFLLLRFDIKAMLTLPINNCRPSCCTRLLKMPLSRWCKTLWHHHQVTSTKQIK